MAEAKGFAYYRNHTTTELWAMLAAGDAWSVGQAGGVWRTARQGLEVARGSFQTNVEDLGQQWRGPASDEFQSRTFLIHDYSLVVEDNMRIAEEEHFPVMVAALQGAQSRAQGDNALGENLHPDYDIEDVDDWMHEVKGLSNEQIAAIDPQTRSTYTTEHASWRQARHDELAQTVADLGNEYAAMANERFAEPAAPPPEGMPGNNTYQQPTTGVFASEGPSGSSSTPSTASGAGGDSSGLTEDDDVASPWELPSYDDIDEPSGGLASGGTAAPGLPVGGGGLGGTTVPGGSTLPVGTGGLFSTGRSSTSGVPGRGPGTTGPARATPTSPGRGGQPGTPGRGSQSGTPGRGSSGRSGTQPNQPGRSGTTSGRGSGTRAGVGKNGSPGANTKRQGDEAEEEETTPRETKYVQAEDIFAAPFDPAVGPAHEGPKHQRAWNKEYDAWKRRQDEDSESEA